MAMVKDSKKLKEVSLDIAYRLIGPGPVVLVSSLYGKKAALTPIAWHMPVSDDPPIVALEIWRDHFIYKAILKTGDFVINIPSDDMVKTVCALGSLSGSKLDNTDKFEKFGLVKGKSKKVKSPRLGSAIGVLECKLRKEPAMMKKYSVIMGDVVWAGADPRIFSDRWHPEKPGPKTIHHLGKKIFSIPQSRII